MNLFMNLSKVFLTIVECFFRLKYLSMQVARNFLMKVSMASGLSRCVTAPIWSRQVITSCQTLNRAMNLYPIEVEDFGTW